jgi:iron complex transport system substrate-binding protein
MGKKVLLFFIIWFCALSVQAKDMRIISLAPSTTEILFALGLDKEIVAVSRSCNYPPQALNKEKVGTFSDPDIEKILSLKPDLIFCTGLKQAVVVIKLRQLGLKVCVSDPADFNELFQSIKEIAGLTGKNVQGDKIIDEMRSAIEEIRGKVKQSAHIKPLRVYVEIWHGPLVTAGKNSFISEILQIAGAVNIADNCAKSYFDITAEEVIASDPQVIIVAYMDNRDAKAELARRPGWKNITAVKNGCVYNDINSDIFLRPSPRLAHGLKEIYKRLYAEK